MSLHLDEPDFHCPRCGVKFIPFRKENICPECGCDVESEDYLNFIKRLAGSMKINKVTYGFYHPPVWLDNRFSDRIQSLVFNVFDALEDARPDSDNSAKLFLLRTIKRRIDFGNEKYLAKHLEDIAFQVYKIYKEERFDQIEYEPIKRSRIKDWFKTFMP